MADLEFVDPATGLALGAHAYGTVAAGVASTAWAIRLRYKWGQSGSGLNSNALLLEVSTDGGTTYSTALAEFTLQVTSVVNVPNDPLFLGAATSVRRTTRLDLPALRAGCAYNVSVVFSPTLRTGAATTLYTWRLGVVYNESYREISLNPDAPTGILTGLGDASVSEWVVAPTLANDTDQVTLGASSCVIAGAAVSLAGGDVALSQDDSASAALGSGEEYIALLSATSGGAVTVTKGVKATSGTAVSPEYPVGELPLAVVRVPYGGVIVTSTLVAVSGRCLVSNGGGRVARVQPGRAVMPGVYLTPATVQTYTCPYAGTVILRLSPMGAVNVTSGVPLASVTTAAGAITAITDLRTLLYQGVQSKLLTTLDAEGQTILNPVLGGASLSLGGDLDAAGHRITNVPLFVSTTDANDAASVGAVRAAPVKPSVRVVATTPVDWPNIVTNGAFAADLSDWAGTNWAWDGVGAALHTAGATDPLVQSRTIVAGITYLVRADIGGAAGTVTPAIGAVSGTPVVAGAGSISQYIVAGAGGTLPFGWIPTTDFDGTIDNVTLQALLYGLVTIDGVSLFADDRVLLAAEDISQNDGKWIAKDAAPWVRHPDSIAAYYLSAGAMVFVREGTVNLKSLWIQVETIANLSTDPQTWLMLFQAP